MNRYIKDFTNISNKHIVLIKNQYPQGFCDQDLVSLKTATGGYFEALEIRTNEAIYLVRVNHDLLEKIEDFEQTEEVTKEIEAEFFLNDADQADQDAEREQKEKAEKDLQLEEE